jgi:hypothetical protein
MYKQYYLFVKLYLTNQIFDLILNEMIIKDILKDTTAMICGRIDPEENNIEKMLGMMEYNRNVLEACHSVILVLNKDNRISEKEMSDIGSAYRENFKRSAILQPHPIGMGYQVGHITLDKTGYMFAKNNFNTKYTMKICNDILLSPHFLDVNVDSSDLYYLPAVSPQRMKNEADIAKRQLSSQTNYIFGPLLYQSWFFIATNGTDGLYEHDEELERVFRTWDFKNDIYQERVICAEHSIVKWSIKNNLKRYSLYSEEQYENYCKYVMSNQIYDGSLKNIMLEPLGITHYHRSKYHILRFNL